MIELCNLTYTHRGADSPTIKDFSLRVEDGETVAVMGPSGCGKSTLLHLIAGLKRPTFGTVKTEGKLAYVFQEPRLFPWLTVLENVRIAIPKDVELDRFKLAFPSAFDSSVSDSSVPDTSASDTSVPDFSASDTSVPDTSVLNRLALEALRAVGLEGAASMLPDSLSGGMKMRVSLARALASLSSSRGGVLLLDEPFAALDLDTKSQISAYLLRFVASFNLSAVLVTHHQDDARLAGRVVEM